MTMREILSKLRDIEDKLDKLQRIHQKRNLAFTAIIPPKELCKDVVNSSLGDYDFQMELLSDYYGVPRMANYHDPEKVSKTAIACYHSFDNAAYYKEPTSPIETILHEFFHHLHANGVVLLGNKSEEELADRFSKLVVERGRSQ